MKTVDTITDEQLRAFIRAGLDVELSMRLGWVTGIAARLGHEDLVPASAAAARLNNRAMGVVLEGLTMICRLEGVDPASLAPPEDVLARVRERVARLKETQ
jgi:hypothetical protein